MTAPQQGQPRGRRFWVTVGAKTAPRLSFGVYADDSITARNDAAELARPDERIDVQPADQMDADALALVQGQGFIGGLPA